MGGLGTQHVVESAQRVVGDVQSQHVALERQQSLLVPLVKLGHRDGDTTNIGSPTEKIHLPARRLALDADHRIDRLLMHRVDRAARMPERVEGSRFRQ